MPSCVCQNQPRASSASQCSSTKNPGSIFHCLFFLGAKINGTLTYDNNGLSDVPRCLSPLMNFVPTFQKPRPNQQSVFDSVSPERRLGVDSQGFFGGMNSEWKPPALRSQRIEPFQSLLYTNSSRPNVLIISSTSITESGKHQSVFLFAKNGDRNALGKVLPVR